MIHKQAKKLTREVAILNFSGICCFVLRFWLDS